ncbi:MAG: hypothetical protein ACERJ2_13695, partial [Filomicrobium sp.]
HLLREQGVGSSNLPAPTTLVGPALAKPELEWIALRMLAGLHEARSELQNHIGSKNKSTTPLPLSERSRDGLAPSAS